MPWPQKSIVASTTPSLFGGDFANQISELFKGIDIGASDITNEPLINTNFRFRSARLKIRDFSNAFDYTIIGSTLTSNFNLTLPALSASDVIVTRNTIETLTSKIVDLDANTIFDTGAVAGGLAKNNGTKYVDFPRGSEFFVLKSTSTDLSWGLVTDDNISSITTRAKLPAPIAFEDEANVFTAINTFSANPKFDTYYDIKAIAAPGNPAAGYARGYVDSGDGKYYIKKSDGTVVDLEAIAGVASDEELIVREAGVAVGGAHKVNFSVASDFDITEDGPNDEYDIKIADNAIGDAHISTHTTTKISTLSKSLLNTEIVYGDQDNDFSNHYFDITEIAVPASPSAGTRRYYVDSTSHEASVVDSTGAIKSLETLSANTIADSHMTAHTTSKISTLSKSLLNPDIVYSDQDNDMGTHFMDFEEMATPATPAAGFIRLHNDTTTGELSVVDSSGAVTSLQTGGSGGGSGISAGGLSIQSGNGTTLVYNIPHGLGIVPDVPIASAASVDALGNPTVTADATNIIITYTVAPNSGTNNLQWHWAAALAPPVSITGFTPTSSNIVTNKIYRNAYFDTYRDIERQASDPAAPSANRARESVKVIDADNDGLIIQIKQAGAFQKVRVI